MIAADIEGEIREIGGSLLAGAHAAGGSGVRRRFVLAPEHWEEVLLRRIMESERFKTQALRFVDVLPTLSDDAELIRHLNEYFVEEQLPLPGIARWGLQQATRGGLAEHAAAAAVRRAVTALAHRFIGGDSAAEAGRSVRRLWDRGMAFTLDVLGEATVSEAEALEYQKRYLDLLREMAPAVARWPERPLLDWTRSDGRQATDGGPQTGRRGDDVDGGPTLNAEQPTLNTELSTLNTQPPTRRRVPRLNLSVKISSLYSQINPVDPDESVAAIRERLRPILASARERGAAITFDMEQYDTKELTLRAFREILLEPEFRDWPDAGIALQAYLRETEADLSSLIDWAREREAPVSVRLVRGAYWDYESIVARQHGWPAPVFAEKHETDRCYERCTRLLLENHPLVEAAIGTHNVRSIALAIAHARRIGLSPDQFEIQMLYGMADPLKEAVAQHDLRLRIYVPFGELIPGMAYLVRRLLENTASQSFLRLGFAEGAPPAELLREPRGRDGETAGREDGEKTAVREGETARPGEVWSASSGDGPPGGVPACGSGVPPAYRSLEARCEKGAVDAGGPRVDRRAPALGFPKEPELPNEPVRRFTDPAERAAFSAALEAVRGRMGGAYPLVLSSDEVTTQEATASLNPARPEQVVGRAGAATAEDARRAVAAALSAFPVWRDLGARGRADHLIRAAQRMRERRDELSAWEVFEVGKHWREADADVAEAIDYLEYYSREAIRLETGQPLPCPPGEENRYFYSPRGVAAIIPPWNFPLAILTGMSAGALAVGNTVVMKPASQSPVIAAQLMSIFREVGLPPGVANYLPGPGAEAGEALVTHPDVQIIAFTGSREVGCRILRLAAEVPDGQSHIKRVIAEMGGKNAIIIDRDADVDDAVLGTVSSAFGYQGQKCSACSRVIVLTSIYDAFLRRLVEATRSLKIGPPDDPGNIVGPVIDARARDRIRAVIEEGKRQARLEIEADLSGLGDGYWIGPTIFSEVDPESDLAQEEIFGPVLCVLRARDMDQALELVNGTRYALTGGIFSRSPGNLERACREFRVGNLYLNRKITGANVGRQPFGGFKLSGVGSKAGGPDYLLQFVEPRVVTENTLRRGFAPE